MVFKRFFIKTVIYSCLIGLLALAMVWAFNQSNLMVGRYTFALLFVLSILNLIYYVNQSNRRVANFLQTFKQLDSIPDEKTKGETFRMIKSSIDSIVGTLKQTQLEIEAERQLFSHTLEHISTGVVAYSASGQVKIFNSSAALMLGVGRPTTVSQLIDMQLGLKPILEPIEIGKGIKVNLVVNQRLVKLIGYSSIIVLDGEPLNLITLSDITHQLSDEEITAYHKLIRVMTHEIMNSVSPIKSLLNSLLRLYGVDGSLIKAESITDSDIQTTAQALNAMQKRTTGLLQFVESYRKLTRIPEPKKRRISLHDLLSEIINLKKPELAERAIEYRLSVFPTNLTIRADENLISQVLLNLLINAMEAVRLGEGIIEISASKTPENIIVIDISDNGVGMDTELLDKIFIPFFTTKESGSGIGLSFAREVVRLHGGQISVKTKAGEGSKVSIVIPAFG